MDNTPLSRRKFLYALPMGGLGLAACTVAEQEAIWGACWGRHRAEVLPVGSAKLMPLRGFVLRCKMGWGVPLPRWAP